MDRDDGRRYWCAILYNSAPFFSCTIYLFTALRANIFDITLPLRYAWQQQRACILARARACCSARQRASARHMARLVQRTMLTIPGASAHCCLACAHPSRAPARLAVSARVVHTCGLTRTASTPVTRMYSSNNIWLIHDAFMLFGATAFSVILVYMLLRRWFNGDNVFVQTGAGGSCGGRRRQTTFARGRRQQRGVTLTACGVYGNAAWRVAGFHRSLPAVPHTGYI